MVHIVHLFPESLGLFGDAGNVLALTKRLEWRGIDSRVSRVELGAAIPATADVYVIGSGSRNSVRSVGEHINEISDALSGARSRGATILAIGAGLHLLTGRIDWVDGSSTRGAGLVDAVSEPRATRLVGEFEGHARGESVAGFINTGHRIVGDVPVHITNITGLDIESDGLEIDSIIGTHSHGSYLPMNPSIADDIIRRVTGIAALDDSDHRIVRATVAAEKSRAAIASRL